MVGDSLSGRSGNPASSHLGKRKKSLEELNNNHNSSGNGPTEDDGVNVEDSGDEGSMSRGEEAQRKKKARTTFTGRQIFELEKQFEVKKYLSSSERADMARLLNVTETQVSSTSDDGDLLINGLGVPLDVLFVCLFWTSNKSEIGGASDAFEILCQEWLGTHKSPINDDRLSYYDPPNAVP